MIRLFDTREQFSKGTEIFGSRFRGARKTASSPAIAHSAITHLRRIREWEVLVAASAGEVRSSLSIVPNASIDVTTQTQLEVFDLRFANTERPKPAMILEGNVNSYRLDLVCRIKGTSNQIADV